MSILTFLIFSSIVYFAIADPIAATTKDQENIDEFIAAIEQAYDKHITPLMESLGKQDQNYFKSTTLNGMAGVLNSCLYHAKTNKGDSKTPIDDEDIILQFDSIDTFPSASFQDPPLCTEP